MNTLLCRVTHIIATASGMSPLSVVLLAHDIGSGAVNRPTAPGADIVRLMADGTGRARRHARVTARVKTNEASWMN